MTAKKNPVDLLFTEQIEAFPPFTMVKKIDT